MTDFVNVPIENNFKTTLVRQLGATSSDLILYCARVPTGTIPVGQKVRVTINPRKGFSYQEDVLVSSIDTTLKTLTITSASDRALNRYYGDSPVKLVHGVQSEVYITDPYGLWSEIQTAVNSKMDKSGGTFTGEILFSGSTIAGLKTNNLTTAQRTALTASNGMIVYDSDIGVHYQYIGGAWSTFATGSVVNAADHTAGKVDIASATELQNGTATDATSGAINVVPVSQTTKTSSGASDHGKVPVLDASGQLATGFVPSGTDATKVSKSTYSAKGSILVSTAAATPADLPVGTNNQVLIADSLQPSGVKWGQVPLVDGNTSNGKTTRANNAASGTQTIAHGLGKIPTSVDITALTRASTDSFCQSVGHWKSGGENSIGYFFDISTASVVPFNDTVSIHLEDVGGNNQKATVTVDATNITLTWVKTGTGAGAGVDMEILWKAYC